MKLKDINFTDITKTISIIVLVLFCVHHGNEFFRNLNNNNLLLHKQIIKISENSIKQAYNVANDKKVEELKKKFESDNSQILAAFNEQKKKTKEILDELGEVQATLKQSRKLNIKSDKIYNKHKDPIHHYFFKKITIKADDGKDIPIAWAMFYPYRDEDKQWKIGTYELKSDTKIIESENRDGSFNRYAEVDLFSKGEKLPIKINSIEWEKVERNEKSFFWWNPRLGLSSILSTELALGLNISIMSYGKTNIDLDYRFLTFGLDYDNINVGLNFEPFSWNIGKMIPLINNIFIGPSVNLDREFGLNVSIPF